VYENAGILTFDLDMDRRLDFDLVGAA